MGVIVDPGTEWDDIADSLTRGFETGLQYGISSYEQRRQERRQDKKEAEKAKREDERFEKSYELDKERVAIQRQEAQRRAQAQEFEQQRIQELDAEQEAAAEAQWQTTITTLRTQFQERGLDLDLEDLGLDGLEELPPRARAAALEQLAPSIAELLDHHDRSELQSHYAQFVEVVSALPPAQQVFFDLDKASEIVQQVEAGEMDPRAGKQMLNALWSMSEKRAAVSTVRSQLISPLYAKLVSGELVGDDAQDALKTIQMLRELPPAELMLLAADVGRVPPEVMAASPQFGLESAILAYKQRQTEQELQEAAAAAPGASGQAAPAIQAAEEAVGEKPGSGGLAEPGATEELIQTMAPSERLELVGDVAIEVARKHKKTVGSLERMDAEERSKVLEDVRSELSDLGMPDVDDETILRAAKQTMGKRKKGGLLSRLRRLPGNIREAYRYEGNKIKTFEIALEDIKRRGLPQSKEELSQRIEELMLESGETIVPEIVEALVQDLKRRMRGKRSDFGKVIGRPGDSLLGYDLDQIAKELKKKNR